MPMFSLCHSPARLSCLLALVAGLGSLPVAAQVLPETPASSTPATPPASAAVSVKKPPASASRGGAVRPPNLSNWNSLSAGQQQALRPLMTHWGNLEEAHRRKWLALSNNFARMNPSEQAKLQSRMAEWASLSPQQRTEARLNFAETKALTAEEKKAKWDAYQTLSGEARRDLAVKAPPRPGGAAPAIKPVAPEKLAIVPSAKASLPRSNVQPSQIDRNTLLPKVPLVAASRPLAP